MTSTQEAPSVPGDGRVVQSTLIALAVYFVATIALLPSFRDRVISDTTAYLNVARAYADLDLHHAVSGMWSPLMSWLVAPLLRMGVDPLLALRAVNIGAGAGALVCISMLAERLAMEALSRYAILAAATALTLWMALVATTSDFLGAACSLLCLVVLLGDKFVERRGRQAGLGVAVACSYFAKPSALPFFAALLAVVGIMRARATGPAGARSQVGALAVAAGVAASLSGVWIYILSAKYHYFTIGTAGAYLFALIGPASDGTHLVQTVGLVAPPTPQATSMWMDATSLTSASWSPLSSAANLQYYLLVILRNVRLEAYILWSLTPLAPVVLADAAVRSWRDLRARRATPVVILFVAVVLHAGGFALTRLVNAFASQRYFYFVALLLPVLAGPLLDAAIRRLQGRSFATIVPAIVVVAAIAFTPLWNVARNRDAYFAETRALARKLVDLGVSGSRVASNDQWELSLRLSFLTGCRYFGNLRREGSRLATEELDAFGIDALMVWDSGLDPGLPAARTRLVLEAPGGHLKVYRLLQR